MISPFTNYVIKGAIWYQGESNIVNYYDYAALQASMVNNWRNVFGIGNFPFYYVQIAPYQYKGSKLIESALQREQQQKALSLIPNSGMVCTLDLGEEGNIHPAAKAEIATRLAALAFSDCYGFKGIPNKSPVFKNMIVKDSLALISFENAEKGLTTYGKTIDCFQLAGNDSVFYPASVSITQRQVKISSPKVKAPLAIRYGFYNFPKTNGYLYATNGLPVVPFRTDDWKLK
jgi:sialate O-acetylesterase